MPDLGLCVRGRGAAQLVRSFVDLDGKIIICSNVSAASALGRRHRLSGLMLLTPSHAAAKIDIVRAGEAQEGRPREVAASPDPVGPMHSSPCIALTQLRSTLSTCCSAGAAVRSIVRRTLHRRSSFINAALFNLSNQKWLCQDHHPMRGGE